MTSNPQAGQKTLFSILMPAYNEYAYIRECVLRVLAAPLPDNVERELVIVDDGSSDGTRDILAELAAAHPGTVRVILHEKNQGKGAAIRTAIREMRGDIAIFQDADLEYDPNDYGRIIQPLLDGYADVVYGSRFTFSDVRRVLFFKHAIGNRILTLLSNWFTDLYLTDMETCYKAFRSSILKSIPIRRNDFGLEPEITAKVAKRGCAVCEVPISYRGRTYEEGKKIGWRDGFRALYVILKYWLIDDCYDERYGHTVLMAMTDAHRYSRWTADLARPHFGRHVLEVGSGIGNLSRRICGARTVTLSDRDPVYLAFLRNLFQGREDVRIAPLDLDRDADFTALDGNGIDSVVAFNVLEHVEDDKAALARIRQLLPQGGRLILQVPQYAALFGSFDTEVGHFRRYGKHGLRSLLNEQGFDIEVMKDLNWLGIPGWYINSVLLKRRNFGKLQLKIFDTLVPLLRLLHWLPLPGLSLFVVAKKR